MSQVENLAYTFIDPGATEERGLMYEVFSDGIKTKREGYDFIVKSVLKQSYRKHY